MGTMAVDTTGGRALLLTMRCFTTKVAQWCFVAMLLAVAELLAAETAHGGRVPRSHPELKEAIVDFCRSSGRIERKLVQRDGLNGTVPLGGVLLNVNHSTFRKVSLDLLQRESGKVGAIYNATAGVKAAVAGNNNRHIVEETCFQKLCSLLGRGSLYEQGPITELFDIF